MERSLKSVLDYIKTFFTTALPPLENSRKRRATTFDSPIQPKINRFSPYTIKAPTRIIPIERENDLSPFLPRKLVSRRSPIRTSLRAPMKRIEDVVVLDDEDDVIEIKKPMGNRFGSKDRIKTYSSTPAEKSNMFANRNGFENGTDDILFIKSTKSPKEKQLEAKLAGFEYIKPKIPSERPLFSIGTGGTKSTPKPVKSKPKYSRSSLNGTLDYTIRLDEKQKYKDMLDQINNSSVYHTPVGKLFDGYDFTKFGHKVSKSPQDKSKGNTKDRLIKFLDSFDNEAVEVKDSDSEDSIIMVNPPSPKPDIKVDPINSFKKMVDTSQVTKEDWLTSVVENHKRYLEDRQKEIDDLKVCTKKSEEINKDISIELLRRRVNDCLQFKEAILPEIIPEPETELPELTEEQLYMVQRAFRGDPNEVLVRKFNLNITRRDLMTLAGLNWLNDEVINFYMNMIIERGNDEKWPKSYAFNTFFYTKLLKDGPQSLRRWTKRVDLFSHDLVCVPIHLGMHWCMAVIDFRDKSIRYYDSMGSPNDRCLEALRHYLEAEHMDKKGTKYNTSKFTLQNMDNIPQQMNGSDCGMFSCTFAEFITRNAKITFTQEDMPYLRKKMVVEIMSGHLLIN